MNYLKKIKLLRDAYFFNRKIKKVMHKDFFFLQIGACDGKKFDPIFKYVEEYNLSGVLVEPIPHLFDKLKVNYANNENLSFENSAVTTYNGTIKMYTISEEGLKELPAWAIGISSIHEDRNSIGEAYWKGEKAKTHLKKGLSFDDIKKYRREVEVPAITFSSLLDKQNITAIDLLVLDTEGHEYEILKQLNDISILPRLIRFEVMNMKEEKMEVDALLKSKGYKTKVINGEDCIAWLS